MRANPSAARRWRLLLAAWLACFAGWAIAGGIEGQERTGASRQADPLTLGRQAESVPGRGLLVLSYHDVRDDVAARGDPDPHAISTRNFAAHLDWLAAHGYRAVGLAQVLDAIEQQQPLPEKSVLLTFDDGLRSHYTRVFPLLRAYGWPAVMAVTTRWIDMAPGATVDYGYRPFGPNDFLTWQQMREMQRSGLVEFVSHSHDLHKGVRANPQGNLMPSAVTRIYDAETGDYESEAAWRVRIRTDLARSAALLERELGQRPRAIVWPYAAYNSAANEIARDLGMALSFDLHGAWQPRDTPQRHGLSRLLLSDNADIGDLAYELRKRQTGDGLRAIQVDLDYVYDPDPAQQERNLDQLVQRMHQLGPSHVFLQAFADPDGDNVADAMYFPNRHLPMRADLFARVAWQLKTRAQVKVFAWMPVLGIVPPEPDLRAQLSLPASPGEMLRLDPGLAAARTYIGDLYEDLAVASYFEGLLFHDDAYLREGEGAPDTSARTDLLIDFTAELQRRAERWRPRLVSVRNLYAKPVLEPASEAWFAQQLPAFLQHYDYVALMAMPGLDDVDEPQPWLDQLARTVAATPLGLRKTVFELQTVDWRSGEPIPGATILAQMRRLQAAGVRHLAYYPDDFVRGLPPFQPTRAAISARTFAYPPR